MEDWLGNKIDVGDKVIYAAGSGRSITMVIGEVVKFMDNGNVRIQPLKSSRWKQHYGTDYYVDTRTEKRFDPWASFDQGTHIKERTHFVHKVTGEKVFAYTLSELAEILGKRYDEVMHAYEYVPFQWNDYVEKRNDGSKPVTISVTENITKWTDQNEGL